MTSTTYLQYSPLHILDCVSWIYRQCLCLSNIRGRPHRGEFWSIRKGLSYGWTRSQRFWEPEYTDFWNQVTVNKSQIATHKGPFIRHFRPFSVHPSQALLPFIPPYCSYEHLCDTSSRGQCRATDCRHQETRHPSRMLFDFDPLFAAIVPALAWRRQGVALEHRAVIILIRICT